MEAILCRFFYCILNDEVGLMKDCVYVMLCSAVVFVVASSITQAVVIDFEEFDNPGSEMQFIGKTYESNGFVFSTFYDHDPSNGRFHYYEKDHRNYQGSAGLVADGTNDVITLTRKDNGPFNVHSIGLASIEYYDFDFDLPVAFRAENADHQYVHHTFYIGIPDIHATFHFPSGFQEIYSLEWNQGAQLHSFDNVDVSFVPEPATLSLIAIGAVLLRRKRASA